MSVPARKTIFGLVLAASLLVAIGSAHAAPSCVTGATTTCTFSYTGAPEAWVVPAGVTSAVFDLYGAAGGNSAVQGWPGGLGGKGGHVQATVLLTPLQTLNMRVGGKGTDGLTSTAPFSVAGGFNGGGTNSAVCGASCPSTSLGGAGGGSSDVRTSADALSDRLLVAGGGGGAGPGGKPSDPGNGGDSATAAKLVSSTLFGLACSGGGAGTLVGPGLAGSGGGCFSGLPGAAGGLDGGGNANSVFGVGAGGGGKYGGGAGASAIPAVASGGGGGSNYPDPLSPPSGITNVTVTKDAQSGNGLITVTYANPTAVTFASAGATRTARGVLVRWRTGTEADLVGFHLYRSRGHSWQRLTRSLIAAKGSVSGASYRFLDRTGKRGVAYRYRIRAVNRDGTAAWFGPVRVT
jgi:hypothetical protein